MDNGLRTYRPSLEKYIYCNPGIQNMVESWISQMKLGNAARSLLFTGPAGTGKTTLAQALANKLEVSSRDITEVNCGSTGTLEAARDLLEGLQFAPMGGEYKVLILDEVHKMGARAQEAFLTPLEKLPKKALIFACTSKPELLDRAFKSRFYSVELSTYSDEAIYQILKGLPFETTEQILQHAVRYGGGVPRKAIDIVEKLGNAEETSITQTLNLAQIKETLGERLLEAMVGPQPNFGVAFLLAGYIEEENKEMVFAKILKLLDLVALTKLNQNPVMNAQEKEIISKIYPTTLVNYWYPIFFKMISDHPRALRALLAQYLKM